MRRAVLAASLLLACGGPSGSGDDPEPADALSRWGLFNGAGSSQEPVAGVIPYEVIAPLFSDGAAKHRFLRIPPGAKIGYAPSARWVFPEGAVAVKTFAFPDAAGGERLIETRLLVREGAGWKPYVYLWNAEQTEATRLLAGARVAVTVAGEPPFDYVVPDVNQCQRCHDADGATDLLGPRTFQLDRDGVYDGRTVNQIDHLDELGLFAGPVPPRTAADRLVDPHGEAPLAERARSYLEANCAHCHTPTGAAGSSGLSLGRSIVDPGFCKLPVSAGEGTGGRSYDVVPGHPEQSILVFRMESTIPDVKMPELPTVLADREGAALVAAWIASLAPPGCP